MALDNDKEVVLVSDDLMIGKLLNFLLLSQGMSPKLENDISKALEYVKNMKCKTSLIIYDLNYPCHEGLKALDAIKQIDTTDNTPQIVLSSHDMDCSLCDKDGSDKCSYFRKPFSTEQLVTKIKEMVG